MDIRRRRSAFTLVELIVVLAIAGILMGLLMVAVQRARESARQSQCQNKLRQLGIALNNHHSAQGSLPPAVVWTPAGEPLGDGFWPIGVIDRVARYGTARPDTIYANWVVLLLPYLDQESLRAAFDLSLPISDVANAKARATDVGVMKCPSDPYNGPDNRYQRGLAAGLTTNEYARGNFAINVGPDHDCIAGRGSDEFPCVGGFIVSGGDLRTTNDKVWGSGIAGANKSFDFAAISDGLSNTVAVDEIRAGIDPLDARGVWALGQVGASAVARHGKFSDAGGPNHCRGSGEEFIGCGALTVKLGRESLQNDCMACDSKLLDQETNSQAGARSMHPGGVNVLLCDGSAHFVADEIDAEIWHALHTRDGGETALLPF